MNIEFHIETLKKLTLTSTLSTFQCFNFPHWHWIEFNVWDSIYWKPTQCFRCLNVSQFFSIFLNFSQYFSIFLNISQYFQCFIISLDIFGYVGWQFFFFFEKKYSNSKYSESRLMLSLVNVISHLMWSHFEIPFTIAHCIKTTDFCYRLAIVITIGLAQVDHIKCLLLYIYIILNVLCVF